MKSLPYWNHNTAYYKWIRRQTANCDKILDVGCGNGLLVHFLDNGEKSITGIDPGAVCIDSCNKNTASDRIQFIQTDFLSSFEEGSYDAVVFVASIHHMDMSAALTKAKSILNIGGKLIIVGLAKPSGVFDFLIEAARIIPVKLISAIKNLQPSEELNIPVSYDIPTMQYIRKTIKSAIPSAHIKYGLYYRYLLSWTNK